jgi:lipopolysaccharide biosynthesis regulator YciM
MQRYRRERHPSAAYNRATLANALSEYCQTYEHISDSDSPRALILLKYVPEQYKLARALMKANLESAELKLHSEDYSATVFHLESALSAEHDLLDALTEELTSL